MRAFQSRVGQQKDEFFVAQDGPWALLDAGTQSRWDFRGCAVAGSQQGACLEPVGVLKDYWFDWRNYHPTTTLYRR